MYLQRRPTPIRSIDPTGETLAYPTSDDDWSELLLDGLKAALVGLVFMLVPLVVGAVTEPTLVATYERDSPEPFELAATDAPGAAREVYDHDFEHAVCAVGVSAASDAAAPEAFETAIVNGED